MAKIVILGAGGFGCSLALMADKEKHKVTIWSPFEQEIQLLQTEREHKKLLPGVKIPQSIAITTSLEAAKTADLIIIATPSFAVRDAAKALVGIVPTNVPVSCVAKGFERGTNKLLSHVIEEELPHNPCVIISGPSHAEEVARGVPTTVVAASKNRGGAEAVQAILMNNSLRLYVNDDVLGVELGGALKNVIAIAAGICDGLQLGDNPKAALMTRGITEIARLGISLGARSETFAGLSGIGDLIVTCTSMHSRNRRAGILIGQGKTAEAAVAEIGMTVEGYIATLSAYDLAKKAGVVMPILTETYKILYQNKKPKDAILDLMQREKRHESELIWLMGR